MKKYVLTLTSLLLVSSLASAEGHRKPPSFDEMDQNGDGVLTTDELRGPLLDDFDKFDVDGSGTLTEDELPEPPEPRQ
ncbi:hypothetical protein [Vibrio hippocampi]|uniref:EF-hand domain-containing protein n=1 Tax=Vibrio hippocampi TaxID=654686 RepID=A0ABM8ZMG3_9VIBR|nr:hypothetical protein [Vibrio hippocampi]CAH0529731.1 hypothetical protein VHP8226_03487 [Vibrio hippocampi]